MSNSCQNVSMRGKEQQEGERGRVPVELRLDERATALLLRAGRGTGRNDSCCLRNAACERRGGGWGGRAILDTGVRFSMTAQETHLASRTGSTMSEWPDESRRGTMGTFLQRRPLGRHPGQGQFDYVD